MSRRDKYSDYDNYLAIKKELLRGYEYFRIKITKPDNLYMAYFLLKQKAK